LAGRRLLLHPITLAARARLIGGRLTEAHRQAGFYAGLQAFTSITSERHHTLG